MRLLDHDEPIDPEIAASLDAIDAVLAGEPVDARYADLAEIALLVIRRTPRRRARVCPVDGRAGGAAGSTPCRRRRRSAGAGARPGGSGRQAARRPRRRRWSWRSWSSSEGTRVSSSSSSATQFSSPVGVQHCRLPKEQARPPRPRPAPPRAAPRAAPANVPPAGSPSTSSAAPTLQPPSTGRKVVQSAQLNLTAPPNRIDDVAQQVYNVIGSRERNRRELDRDPRRSGRLRGVPAEHPERVARTGHEPPVVTERRAGGLAHRLEPGHHRPVRPRRGALWPTPGRCGPRCSSSWPTRRRPSRSTA